MEINEVLASAVVAILAALSQAAFSWLRAKGQSEIKEIENKHFQLAAQYALELVLSAGQVFVDSAKKDLEKDPSNEKLQRNLKEAQAKAKLHAINKLHEALKGAPDKIAMHAEDFIESAVAKKKASEKTA